MKLETVKKDYDNGLLLRAEAVQTIEALGETRFFAEKYLDGFTSKSARTQAGASRLSLLVVRD